MSRKQQRARRIFAETYGYENAPLRPEIVVSHVRAGRRVRQHERLRRLRRLSPAERAMNRPKAVAWGVD